MALLRNAPSLRLCSRLDRPLRVVCCCALVVEMSTVGGERTAGASGIAQSAEAVQVVDARAESSGNEDAERPERHLCPILSPGDASDAELRVASSGASALVNGPPRGYSIFASLSGSLSLLESGEVAGQILAGKVTAAGQMLLSIEVCTLAILGRIEWPITYRFEVATELGDATVADREV